MAASIIILYRLFWRLIGLGLPFYLGARAAQGKEDLKRLGERYGYSMHKRPHGLVYWLHGASVGETVSSLTLAQAILDQQPSSSVLITSGTKTS
ncbi:MAG: 3-deoxy-D-manno-octulosonic acid transferase, partial [Rhodobacteraceae bacterium]|nr:3-deoxy-D-manno-octulosonic acid transferase [Paracoccaceae bacterium]